MGQLSDADAWSSGKLAPGQNNFKLEISDLKKLAGKG
jgi:hypothetical protein